MRYFYTVDNSILKALMRKWFFLIFAVVFVVLTSSCTSQRYPSHSKPKHPKNCNCP